MSNLFPSGFWTFISGKNFALDHHKRVNFFAESTKELNTNIFVADKTRLFVAGLKNLAQQISTLAFCTREKCSKNMTDKTRKYVTNSESGTRYGPFYSYMREETNINLFQF